MTNIQDRYEVTVMWRGNSARRIFRGDIGLRTAKQWIEDCQQAQEGRAFVQVLKNNKPFTIEEVAEQPQQHYRARKKWSSFDPADSQNTLQKGDFIGWVVNCPKTEDDVDEDIPADPLAEDENRPKLMPVGIMIEYVRSREEFGNFTLPGARFYVNLRKQTVTDKPKPSFARYNDDSIIMDGPYPKVDEVHIKSHRTVSLESHRFGAFLAGFAEEIKASYDEAKQARKQKWNKRRAM